MSATSANSVVSTIMVNARQVDSLVVCIGPELRKAFPHLEQRRLFRAIAELSPRIVVAIGGISLLKDELELAGRDVSVLYYGHTGRTSDWDLVSSFQIHGNANDRRTLLIVLPAPGSVIVEVFRDEWKLRHVFSASLVIVVGYWQNLDALGPLYEQFGSGASLSDWFVLTPEVDRISDSLWRSRGVKTIRINPAELVATLEKLQQTRSDKLILSGGRDLQSRVPQEKAQIFISSTTRNMDVRAAVIRTIRGLGLTPVSANDQPSGGLTIQEKFDKLVKSSSAAIVILGPEDLSGRDSGSARANAIFELGYLMGVLGRDRVIPILIEGTRAPSDLAGVRYISIDRHFGEEVETYLRRSIENAGIQANRS